MDREKLAQLVERIPHICDCKVTILNLRPVHISHTNSCPTCLRCRFDSLAEADRSDAPSEQPPSEPTSSMGDEPRRAVRMEGSPINQQLQSGPSAEMPTSPTQSHSLPRESPEADTLVIGPTDGSRACRSTKHETYGASETSDRERARKIIFEMHEREGEDAIVEWIAAIRAGQPRLMAEDVQKVAYKLLLPERTLEWSERTAAKFVEVANDILDAKSRLAYEPPEGAE